MKFTGWSWIAFLAVAYPGWAVDHSTITIENYILANPAPLQHGIHEGGLSGLVHLSGDPANIVYSVSDRGPNSTFKTENEVRLTFPDPEFGPMIFKIALTDGKAHILERIAPRLPLHQTTPTSPGQIITGLPNLQDQDGIPYDASGRRDLPYDPHGLDTEGIAWNPSDKTFWLCDEYSPSLIHLGIDGRIIERLVPAGFAAKLKIPYAKDALPALYAKRQANRGFEGVTITPDGRFLYGAMQSPLENPNAEASKQGRLTRLIKIDLATGQPVAEYIYSKEDAKPLGLKQNQIVVSDLFALSEHRFIVDERDNQAGPNARIKRLYIADFSRATNILGRFDGPTADGLTLEQHTPDELNKLQIVPASKSLLLDVAAQGFPYEKIEGVCLLGPKSIAIVNDNDFSFDGSSGSVIDTRQSTQITVYRFPSEIR